MPFVIYNFNNLPLHDLPQDSFHKHLLYVRNKIGWSLSFWGIYRAPSFYVLVLTVFTGSLNVEEILKHRLVCVRNPYLKKIMFNYNTCGNLRYMTLNIKLQLRYNIHLMFSPEKCLTGF